MAVEILSRTETSVTLKFQVAGDAQMDIWAKKSGDSSWSGVAAWSAGHQAFWPTGSWITYVFDWYSLDEEYLIPNTTYDMRLSAGDNVMQYFSVKTLPDVYTTAISGAVFVENTFPPRPPVDTVRYARGLYGTGWGDGAYGGLVANGSQDITIDITGQVRISAEPVNNINGAVRIRRVSYDDIDGAVDILKPGTSSISGSVMIAGEMLSSITGTVCIDNPNQGVRERNIYGIVDIEKPGSDYIEGSINIERKDVANISGGVTITKPQTSTIEGLTRVENTNYLELFGRVRIRVSTPEKLPEDWNKYDEPEPLEWEKDAGVEPMDWHYNNPEKDTESWTDVDKESQSWKSDDGEEPETWHYPLEDSR